jgi:hypothetical protein
MVVFVAVTAGQITAPHRNQMGEYRMTRGNQGAADKAKLPDFLLNEFDFPHYLLAEGSSMRNTRPDTDF